MREKKKEKEEKKRERSSKLDLDLYNLLETRKRYTNFICIHMCEFGFLKLSSKCVCCVSADHLLSFGVSNMSSVFRVATASISHWCIDGFLMGFFRCVYTTTAYVCLYVIQQ